MKFARIDLSKTNYSLIGNWSYLVPTEKCIRQCQTIYKKYCVYKKFDSVMPLFDLQFYEQNSDLIGYSHNNNLVAFSLIKRYNPKEVESLQFAWDYANPNLRLGILSLQHECAIYKARGFEYLYLGQAQDYKSQFDGYEILGTI
jgi:Arginine-tRNA-protein transferase, C terminus